MNRVTVGGLTPARSANRATLSRPAIGYDASSARARRRSAGLRESRRWRTSSTTRCSVTDITFHPELWYFGTFLTKSIAFARNLVSKAMSREERPRIGITTSPRRGLDYYDAYKRAVEAVGAEAVGLPPGATSLANLGGLLLPGGWDVDPAPSGEKPDPKVGSIDRELDDTELRLFAQARDQNLPVMGICRGQQVINVAMGGSLQQHLDGHEVRQFGRNHLAHAIEADPRSELGRAAGDKKIRVNSLHHQAIDKL